MKCPNCKNNNIYVLDTRPSSENSIRRRRVCLDCDHRWTTYEYSKEDLDNRKIKKFVRIVRNY